MKKKKETRGRPKLGKHARTHIIKVRVTEEEKAQIENRAKNKGRSVPAWLRWKLGLAQQSGGA